MEFYCIYFLYFFSHNDVISGRHDNHEHVNNILHRYHNLLRDTRQSLDESRDNILQTLEKLQNDLDLFIKHTDCDTAYKRKVARLVLLCCKMRFDVNI